jgi:hypothetical protein
MIPDAFKARLFRLVKWDQISWEEAKLGCFGLFLLLMIVGSELDILSGIILWSSILLCVILFEFSFLNSQLKSRIHYIIENFDLNETGSDKEETQKEKGIMGNFNQHKGINRHDHYGFGKIETCGPQVVLENENILQRFFQNEIQRPRIPTAEDWTFIYRYLFIKIEMAKMLRRMVSVSTSWKAYGILKHFQPIRLVVCYYSVPELNDRYIWDTNFRNGILQILREKSRWDRMN